VLHKKRIQVVAPSRVQHSLFAEGPHGSKLRPTVLDLINRDVIRGLGIARRWRMGLYIYSNSVSSSFCGLCIEAYQTIEMLPVVNYTVREQPSSDTPTCPRHYISTAPVAPHHALEAFRRSPCFPCASRRRVFFHDNLFAALACDSAVKMVLTEGQTLTGCSKGRKSVNVQYLKVDVGVLSNSMDGEPWVKSRK
jgi:hypothetical protein